MKKHLTNEDGAVIVLVALWLTIFIGFTALVIDVGSLYLEKNRLQKIVDAAALAGAQELPTSFQKAQSESTQTIQANGGNPNNFTIDTNTKYTMIEVNGKVQGTLYFAKALGVKESMIEARARVELQPLSSGKGAIPLGIQSLNGLSFGSRQYLKVSDSANGNFGAIALTGPGAKNYETDLTFGYDFQLKVGQILNTETGRMAKPTVRAISHRITNCPNATYLNYPANCDRVVLIPMYQPQQGDKQKIDQVKVIGFGTFFIEAVSETSEGATVVGYFIQATQAGDSSANQTDFGTYSFKLTQ